jgi:pilus assembly protein CpaC
VQGRYEERQVRVDQGGKQQVLLNSLVAELNRSELENQGLNYSVALAHYGVTLVGLPGVVGTPYSAQGTSSGSNTPISLTPGGTIMPLLLSQNITYGLAGQNSNVLTQTFFQFLEQHNLARILAQPQLLANSGEEAKFLSGGEIPIVIAQALNTSIVFKQFGTQVQFVPTVVGSSDVELQVKTEVSQPDYAHGVQLFGFDVPAFIARRAETMVRLRDNQTLIIAGLILHDKRETIEKVPYLGDIPYAGGLFRNTTWQDTESDLVMAVTPQLIRPLPAQGKVFVAARRGPLSSYEIGTRRTTIPDAGRPRF